MTAAVKILFFASLREDVGLNEVEVEAVDTAELMAALAQKLPAEAMQILTQDNVRLAVNQQLIEGTVQLQPGDEIAFLPPVTGG